jgi:hypothetical protein
MKITSCLELLEQAIADHTYICAATTEEAYRSACEWLRYGTPSSADTFYQRVQTAAAAYAGLRDKQSPERL